MDWVFLAQPAAPTASCSQGVDREATMFCSPYPNAVACVFSGKIKYQYFEGNNFFLRFYLSKTRGVAYSGAQCM